MEITHLQTKIAELKAKVTPTLTEEAFEQILSELATWAIDISLEKQVIDADGIFSPDYIRGKNTTINKIKENAIEAGIRVNG